MSETASPRVEVKDLLIIVICSENSLSSDLPQLQLITVLWISVTAGIFNFCVKNAI